jgi:CheY-like chemotaxis protein
VVEDNETNRIVLDEMLRHLGHRVTLAFNGADGVDAARATQFDVILMDLSMPLMDGWTAATAIRLGGASQQSRILAVTAHARREDDGRMTEAGFDGWLTKPLTIRTLGEILSGAIPPGRDPRDAEDEVPLLDLERHEELRQLMTFDGFSDLRKRLDDEMEGILSAVQVASEAKSLQEFVAQFHSAAGAAGVVGATRLGQMLARQEEFCSLNDLPRFRSGMNTVKLVWKETHDAWRVYS